MAAAVPFALKAGIPLAASLVGKKLSGPSGAQKSAMTGTQTAANQLGGMAPPLLQQGQQLTGQGTGYLQEGARSLAPAASYYGNILSNRRGARESLAPEMTTALDFYKGAQNKTARTMRGGSRDYASAELDRQKVGQMAGMLPAARANAAQGAANVGGAYGGMGGTAMNAGANATGQGVNAASNAAYVNSGLFNQATGLQQQQGEGGKAWGSLLFDIAKNMPWGKGKTGGGGIFSNVPMGGAPPVSRGV